MAGVGSLMEGRCECCGREPSPGDKAPAVNMAKHIAACRPPKQRFRPLIERLESRLRQDSLTGCLIWTGTVDRRGYGKIGAGGRGGKSLAAHRVAWEFANGPIPDGAWVLHRCDVPACCNPSHLFLGDSAANVADMVSKGRHRPRGLKPVRIGERRRRIATGHLG